MKYSHLRKIFIAAAVGIFLKSTADVQPSTVVISISEKNNDAEKNGNMYKKEGGRLKSEMEIRQQSSHTVTAIISMFNLKMDVSGNM